MPWARMFAERLRLPVELLAVVDVKALLTSVEGARRFDALVELTSAQSKTYLERVSGRFVGLKVKRRVAQGNVVDIIVEKAAEPIDADRDDHSRSRWAEPLAVGKRGGKRRAPFEQSGAGIAVRLNYHRSRTCIPSC